MHKLIFVKNTAEILLQNIRISYILISYREIYEKEGNMDGFQ